MQEWHILAKFYEAVKQTWSLHYLCFSMNENSHKRLKENGCKFFSLQTDSKEQKCLHWERFSNSFPFLGKYLLKAEIATKYSCHSKRQWTIVTKQRRIFTTNLTALLSEKKAAFLREVKKGNADVGGKALFTTLGLYKFWVSFVVFLSTLIFWKKNSRPQHQ